MLEVIGKYKRWIMFGLIVKLHNMVESGMV